MELMAKSKVTVSFDKSVQQVNVYMYNLNNNFEEDILYQVRTKVMYTLNLIIIFH